MVLVTGEHARSQSSAASRSGRRTPSTAQPVESRRRSSYRCASPVVESMLSRVVAASSSVSSRYDSRYGSGSCPAAVPLARIRRPWMRTQAASNPAVSVTCHNTKRSTVISPDRTAHPGQSRSRPERASWKPGYRVLVRASRRDMTVIIARWTMASLPRSRTCGRNVAAGTRWWGFLSIPPERQRSRHACRHRCTHASKRRRCGLPTASRSSPRTSASSRRCHRRC